MFIVYFVNKLVQSMYKIFANIKIQKVWLNSIEQRIRLQTVLNTIVVPLISLQENLIKKWWHCIYCMYKKYSQDADSNAHAEMIEFD